MKYRTLFLLLLAASFAPMANAQTPAPADTACQVWQRELSFAQSVQQHDRAAFVAHIADDAVFGANTARPTRGRDAIVRHWAGILDGKAVRLSWYPQYVVVAGGGTLAYSSGPYVFENHAPHAKTRYTAGHFHTTWARGSDGIWRVAFDGGDDGKAADAATVNAFETGRRRECPQQTDNG